MLAKVVVLAHRTNRTTTTCVHRSCTAAVKIRIYSVPLTDSIEGIDLRAYDLRPGHVYDIGSRLAELLIVSGYAEPEMPREDLHTSADKRRRD